MLALLDEAIEALRRQRFLEQVNAAYAGLRVESHAWESIEAERRAWDATLGDGMVATEARAPYRARTGRGKPGKRR